MGTKKQIVEFIEQNIKPCSPCSFMRSIGYQVTKTCRKDIFKVIKLETNEFKGYINKCNLIEVAVTDGFDYSNLKNNMGFVGYPEILISKNRITKSGGLQVFSFDPNIKTMI